MNITEQVGTELPEGELMIEPWRAFLWAEATHNEDDAFRYDERVRERDTAGQLVPPSMCQHLTFEAGGGIEATIGHVADDWSEGAALGQLRAEFHAPIKAGVIYHVTGHIADIERKEGSSSELTIVTFAYEVVTDDGDPTYDLEVDLILMDT